MVLELEGDGESSSFLQAVHAIVSASAPKRMFFINLEEGGKGLKKPPAVVQAVC
jgi:hypothetical protein